LTNEPEVTSIDESLVNYTSLTWIDLAEICCLTSCDAAVRIDVGEDHLFLL
jgi:hypothetical protein